MVPTELKVELTTLLPLLTVFFLLFFLVNRIIKIIIPTKTSPPTTDMAITPATPIPPLFSFLIVFIILLISFSYFCSLIVDSEELQVT